MRDEATVDACSLDELEHDDAECGLHALGMLDRNHYYTRRGEDASDVLWALLQAGAVLWVVGPNGSPGARAA